MQLQQAQLQKRITVWEAVTLWASLYRTAVNGDRLIEQLGLSDKRQAWFTTLSGGQKQRLCIALALINDPELVVLDELTTALDPQARRAIWDLQRGKTVLLTTHLMEEAEKVRLARLSPLTYAVSLLRGIWHGAGWLAHAGDAACLTLMFVVFTAVSARVFRGE